MILVWTLVLLLFIPLGKWYKNPTIYWELSGNYKSTFLKKSLWKVTVISLKPVTYKADKSWFQKQKLGLEGAGCFIL